MERCNYNLDSYIECARRGETFEGRLVSHLLTSPSEDGGQWDMLVNLVEKYGVIPKVCFKDAQSATESRILCGIINNKVTSLSKTCQYFKTLTCSIVQSIGHHIQSDSIMQKNICLKLVGFFNFYVTLIFPFDCVRWGSFARDFRQWFLKRHQMKRSKTKNRQCCSRYVILVFLNSK